MQLGRLTHLGSADAEITLQKPAEVQQKTGPKVVKF